MNRYTAAEARQKFSRVLDQAAAGKSVIIERRGNIFLVCLKPVKTKHRARASRLWFIDEAIASGQWSWNWQATEGLDFVKPNAKIR